jgi:hypothetical protein
MVAHQQSYSDKHGSPHMISHTISHYRIIEKLVGGSMGMLHKALSGPAEL